MTHRATSWWIHVAAALPAIAFALAGYHFGIKRPQEMSRLVASLQSEAVRLETVAAHQPKTLHGMVENQFEAEAPVPEALQVFTPTSVLQQIQGLAHSLDLTIDRSEPLGFQSETSTGWSFRVSGMGTFAAIIQLCDELDSLPLEVEITHLRLERLGGNTLRWQLDGASAAVLPPE